MFISFYITNAYSQQSFNGSWKWSNSNSEFSITINQQSNTITGSHCSILQNGLKVDCADSNETTLNGTIQGDSLVVNFKSAFSMTVGIAVIKKLNDTSIQWEIVQKPNREFYIPSLVIMTKQ